MPLVILKQMLAVARRDGWAVAAFNPVDYASLKAMIQAAAELDAPVIAQTSVKTVHGKDIKLLEKCIETGWTAVMIDASDKPYDENVALTRQVLQMAAKKDVGVETELGEIAGVEEDIIVAESNGHHAEAEQALEFIRDTPGLAVFAPAIGTAHGVYKKEPKIDWEALTKISKGSSMPLALHGGTGLSDEILQRAIRLGCSKVNISTNLKHVFVDSFVNYHQSKPTEYEPVKVLEAQFAGMKALFNEKIRQFGGAGRAGTIKG